MLDCLVRPLEAHGQRVEALLADAATWSPAHLRERPHAAAWCALDVLDHLARTERAIAESMARGLLAPMPIPTADRVKCAMVFAAMQTPVRVKTPPGVAAILPETPESREAAEAALRAAHVRLVRVAEGVSNDVSKRGVFRHPVGGWMSPETTIRFVAAHLRHHQFQWQRLKQQSAVRQAG